MLYFVCIIGLCNNPNDPQLMVRCYSSGSCGGILFNGDDVPAGDCCTIHGNSLRTPPGGEGGSACHRCISKNETSNESINIVFIAANLFSSAVGFKQTSISVAGVNTSHAITVESNAFDETATYSLGVELSATALDANRRM